MGTGQEARSLQRAGTGPGPSLFSATFSHVVVSFLIFRCILKNGASNIGSPKTHFVNGSAEDFLCLLSTSFV